MVGDRERDEVSGDARADRMADVTADDTADDTADRTAGGGAGVRPEVRATVESVADPEMPAVTIGMLGMVHDLHESDGTVVVELLPTFAGCPATDMIREDVETALAEVDGVDRVEVVFRYSPVWTPQRISAEGRARLVDFGIAPPLPPASGDADGSGGATVTALPIVSVTEATSGRTCPWCGSTATERDSAFGPTPCRDLWMCTACRQPFEGFKSA